MCQEEEEEEEEEEERRRRRRRRRKETIREKHLEWLHANRRASSLCAQATPLVPSHLSSSSA
jgi:hypothetical protein